MRLFILRSPLTFHLSFIKPTERVEDPTPSASATEVARENPYTSLPHIGTDQGWLIVTSHTLGGIFTAVKRETRV